MRVRNLVQHLSDLAVRARRKEYFDRVDRLRALGQSTLEEAAPTSVIGKPRVRLSHGGEAHAEVARFLRHSSYSTGEGTEVKSYFQQRWLDLLSGYLTNNPATAKTEDVDDGEIAAADVTGFSPPLQDQARRLTCLLCKHPCARRDNLTSHFEKMHVNKGTFSQEFPCPECRRRINPDCLITTSLHGVATSRRPTARRMRQTYARIHIRRSMRRSCAARFVDCTRRYRGWVNMSRAMSVPEQPAPSSQVLSPCLACRHRTLDAEQDVMIDGCPAWNAHISSAHGRVAESWSVGDSWNLGNKPKNQFMCLLYAVLLSGCPSLTQHYKRTHMRRGTVNRHFPCPECRRSRSDKPVQLITSASSWSNHVEKVHGINYMPLLRTDATAKEVKSRCPFCGLCFDQRGFYAHFRSRVCNGAASDIFTSAFPCLRCSRDEQGARETERVMIEG
jgi:hypothetical protein